MRRPSQHPSRLADSLQRLVQRIDPEQRLKVYRLWSFWDEEVGEPVAAHAQPAGYRAGVLSVRVNSPVWMQELQFLKEIIRERLNQRLGDELIRDIFFVSGTAPAPPPRPTTSLSHPDVEPAALPALPAMRDQRLAAIFQRIVRAHARRQSRVDPPAKTR